MLGEDSCITLEFIILKTQMWYNSGKVRFFYSWTLQHPQKLGIVVTPLLLAKGCSAASALPSSWCHSPASCSPSATGTSSWTRMCGSSGWFLGASPETPPVSVVLSGVALTRVVGWDSGSVCLCLSPVLLQNPVLCFPGEFMPLWVVLRKCLSLL